MRPVLDPLAEHGDGAALGDLPLEASEEPAPRGAVLVEGQRRGRLGLGGPEEGGQLGEVHAELAVVVVGAATAPAGAIAGRPFAHRARLATDRRGAPSARCR